MKLLIIAFLLSSNTFSQTLRRNVGGDLPEGAVMAFARQTCPEGWIEANGAQLSRSTYSKLFAAIGTAHGYGDNSTTFNLPDYRGRFLRGHANGSGNDPDRASRTAMATGGLTGDNVGSIQNDAFQGHKHSYHWKPVYSAGAGVDEDKTNDAPTTTRTDRVGLPITDGVNGTPRTAYETRPKNVNVKYCVKY